MSGEEGSVPVMGVDCYRHRKEGCVWRANLARLGRLVVHGLFIAVAVIGVIASARRPLAAAEAAFRSVAESRAPP